MRIRDLCKLPYGRDCLWEKLALVGRTMLSKSLVQFSANGWDCAPCLYFDLRSLWSLLGLPYSTLYGGLMAASSKRTYANMLCFPGLLLPLSLTLWQATVDPPTPLPEAPNTGKSGSASCGVAVPFTWVLVRTGFCLCPPRSLLFP